MTGVDRIADEEIARAKTRLDLIAADVALKRKGRELAGNCPFHPDKTPSFFVVPEKGFWICFGCGATGDAISFVMRKRGLQFSDAVREINGTELQRAREARVVERTVRAADQRPDVQGHIEAILRACGPAEPGTAAHLYLHLRGLVTCEAPSRISLSALRSHPSLYCKEYGGPLPALIAPIESSAGITALQRIWLTPRVEYAGGAGPKDNRAPLNIRKKTIGDMLDGAVRLMPPKRRFGLAEGVETAIAAALENRGTSVWATCGASRLGSVTIPEGVETVVIYGDNGEPGEALAHQAAEKYRRHGYAVDVVFPRAGSDDFNDELLADRRGSVAR